MPHCPLASGPRIFWPPPQLPKHSCGQQLPGWGSRSGGGGEGRVTAVGCDQSRSLNPPAAVAHPDPCTSKMAVVFGQLPGLGLGKEEGRCYSCRWVHASAPVAAPAETDRERVRAHLAHQKQPWLPSTTHLPELELLPIYRLDPFTWLAGSGLWIIFCPPLT